MAPDDSELQRLQQLHRSGALTDAEYIEARKRYLGRLATGNVAQQHLRRTRAGGEPVSFWQDVALGALLLVGGLAVGFAVATFTSSPSTQTVTRPGPTVTVSVVQTVTAPATPTG